MSMEISDFLADCHGGKIVSLRKHAKGLNFSKKENLSPSRKGVSKQNKTGGKGGKLKRRRSRRAIPGIATVKKVPRLN